MAPTAKAPTTMIKVHVTTGIGLWTASRTIKLAACPHVGDDIEVYGVTVHCDSVCITSDGAIVREKRPFTTQEALTEFDAGVGDPEPKAGRR